MKKKVIIFLCLPTILFFVFVLSITVLAGATASAQNVQQEEENKDSDINVDVPVKGDWALPVSDKNAYYTCLFGDDMLNGVYRWHSGVDISGADFYSTAILASNNGVVSATGYAGDYGNYVLVSHGKIDGDQYTTMYAHLSFVNVRMGDEVTQGQKLGYGGNTGLSFGAHLHFEVRVNGVRVDPKPYLPKIPEYLV